MRKQTRAQVLGSVDLLLEPGAWIVVVGPMCRTWFSDQGALYELFEYLATRPAQVAVLGGPPFLFCARAGAQNVKAKPLFVPEESATADALYAQATVCVALAPRTSPLPEKASSYVQRAFQDNKPVWVIWPDESFTFIGPGQAVVKEAP